MITGHLPAVRLPPDHAARVMAAAVPASTASRVILPRLVVGVVMRYLYRFKTSNRVSDLGIHGGWLRRPVVLVDHASEHLASTDRCVRWHYSGLILVGWSLLTGLVRAVPVVMADVLAQD